MFLLRLFGLRGRRLFPVVAGRDNQGNTNRSKSAIFLKTFEGVMRITEPKFLSPSVVRLIEFWGPSHRERNKQNTPSSKQHKTRNNCTVRNESAAHHHLRFLLDPSTLLLRPFIAPPLMTLIRHYIHRGIKM